MKSTVISILVAGLLIGGAIYVSIGSFGGRGDLVVDVADSIADGKNVSIVDGKQIIEITARGGYSPRKSVAKAGIPAVLRFDTSGTFDCSAAVRIPSLNISKMLPNTGTTDIDIGTQQVSTFHGTCGMGMYPFEVEFN